MSNFKGWTIEEVNKLLCKNKTEKTKSNRKESKQIAKIADIIREMGYNVELEYKFIHDRRFRFDIAVPEIKVAIEYEGGIFTGGRHLRSTGYANDCKKYNLAVKHGWRLFRFTIVDMENIKNDLISLMR